MENSSIKARLSDVIKKAKEQGADQADCLYADGISLSLSSRNKKLEHLDREEGKELGLRVFVGKKQACVSTSDLSTTGLANVVEKAVSMAKAVPEDPFCGLADTKDLTQNDMDLESMDPVEVSEEKLIENAIKAEETALNVKGITNSEGANASASKYTVSLMGSNGFYGEKEYSYHSLSVSVIAGEGTKMERDYDFSAKVFAKDLDQPENIGKKAAEKTIEKLNPQKIKSFKGTVIYDPRVSSSLLGHLASAVNGSAIARGTSFLKDKMNEQIFSETITLTDDPHRKRGLRSKPFDDEGLATQKRNIVEKGVLQSWFLDLHSARELGLKSTGHAVRGMSSTPSPSPTNFFCQAGDVSPKDLMKDIKSGLYITELIGFGVNGVTGDYSRGASGFYIENGEITYPVSELTIAGNLLDMFKKMTPANDLEFKFGTDAPTIRIDDMMVGGI